MKTRAPAPKKKNIALVPAAEPTQLFQPRPFPESGATETVQADPQSPNRFEGLNHIPLLPPEQQPTDASLPLQAKGTPQDTLGSPIEQSQHKPDEEVMAMPASAVQREPLAPEEEPEETLQTKTNTLQRAATPEEEPEEKDIQAKPELQREATLSEEKDDTEQVKPQLQREALPEKKEELMS